MAKFEVKVGTISKLLRFFVQDSSQAIVKGLSGLVFNSASLTAYYAIEGAASTVAITLATMTFGTWATGGFVEVDATHMPGVYELGIPNLALASGKSVLVYLQGAANMSPVMLEVETTATDNQDGVRGGMTALPNAAANAAGGLLISTAGALDMDDLAADVDATETRVTLALPAAAAGAATGLLTLATAVRTTGATAETIEDALNAARAQGFGKWAIVGTTLSLYANDGSTVVRAFTLDSATVPTSRI